MHCALKFRDAVAARTSARRKPREQRFCFEIPKPDAIPTATFAEIDLTAFDGAASREKRRKRTAQISDRHQNRRKSPVLSE
jgi:hypothetical protein